MRFYKQKGTALMTAMVIMTITAAVAYYLIMQQRTTVFRSTYLFNYDQAYHYANGATAWAEDLLMNRFIASAENEQVVVINDVLPPIEVPFDNAVVTARLEDLQGKFNLNTLVFDDALNDHLEQLNRLLSVTLADSNQQQINQIIASITEHVVQIGVGQLPFDHISQLRMIDGITADIYQQLLPYVTVLPEPTDININTADSIVLQSLLPEIPPNQIEALIAARQQTPFTSAEDLTAQLGGVDLEFNSDGMTVDSQYFLLTTIVDISEQRLVLFTIFQVVEKEVIEGDELPVVRIVWRSIGTV